MDDKIIRLIDDGSCKSGYQYTLDIQKSVYNFLKIPFPRKVL